MKSAKLFFAAMYLHLAASIAAPVGIIATAGQGWGGPAGLLLLLHLAIAMLAQTAGWVCVGFAWKAYYGGQGDALRSAWKLLKLYTIPFYLVNFAWSFLAWFMLVGASRGILILFVPIPVVFTCLFTVESGCVGHRYLRWLAGRPGGQPGVTGLLTFLQFVPVLDVVSTAVLLRRTAEGARQAP